MTDHNLKSNREIEYKCLCSAFQYQALLALYQHQYQEITQTNIYYIDQARRLKQLQASLRERRIGTSRLITLKIHRQNQLWEYEKAAETLEDPEILELLANYDIYPPFIRQAELLTVRRLVELPTAELCLDENHYYGITDYEIEYELKYPHDGLADFLLILKKADITYRANRLSKHQRALRAST